MTQQFKVGDRVRVLDNVDNRHAMIEYPEMTPGSEYVVQGLSSTTSWLYVPGSCEGWNFDRFELVEEPRKDTPAEGDTVRVVLEGKVAHLDEAGFGISARGALSDNYIVPDHGHVKSIEIITPAKPSVKDLPAWAVVKNKDTGEIAVRVAATAWWNMVGDPAGAYNHADIDRINWVQLVPKVDE